MEVQSWQGKEFETYFDNKLQEILGNMTGAQLLAIPGIYEIVSEEFNNGIIEQYDADRPYRLAEKIRKYHDRNCDINGRYMGHIRP